jgi:hypothetical protein
MFMIASIMAGRFDRWQTTQAEGYPSSQFNGAGREILHWAFIWLFALSVFVGLISFALTALVKRRGHRLSDANYATLFYWAGLMPVVGCLFAFPAWALWMTVRDFLKYMK